LRIWALGAVAALVLAPSTWWHLEQKHRAAEANRANQAVAAQVAAARAEVSRKHLEEGAAMLQTALATEGATDFDEARGLLTDIRREQASALFRAAESALANRQPLAALDFLQRYLEDPYATERSQAADLREQLSVALSDEQARAFLQNLTYPALVDFGWSGKLESTEVTHPDVRALYSERLRGHVEQELLRRREDHARRVQSIQATPAYGELHDFATLTRRRLAQRSGGQIDHRLLARLFRELNVNREEQNLVRAGLSAHQLDLGEAEKLARLRASLKERFRTYKDFDKSDRELFDWLVDQEMNKLLQELQGLPGP
jgi:hypothetical protein